MAEGSDIREQMELLTHSPGYARIRQTVQREIKRRAGEWRVMANLEALRKLDGFLEALEWVLRIPDDIHKENGGSGELRFPEERPHEF